MKSLLAAAAMALSASAAAADRKAVRSLQLDLDLAPRVERSADVVSAVDAVDPVRTAFHSGIAEDYARAVLASGEGPPLDDEGQQGLLKDALDRREADRLWPGIRKSMDAPEAPPRKTVIDFVKFGKQVDGILGFLPADRVFDGTGRKREILFNSDLTHLKGPGKARIPLELASPFQIGEAYRKYYRSLQRSRGARR